MKRALCHITWKPSPSTDVAKQIVQITKDGDLFEAELVPGASEYDAKFEASKTAAVAVKTIDTEGRETTSMVLTITLGDLEDPLPATDLKFEILSVEDIQEEPALVTPTPTDTVPSPEPTDESGTVPVTP